MARMTSRAHPVTPPSVAYSRFRRVKDAYRFIQRRAALSPDAMERTQSKHVAATFGVEVALIKRIKARFRNELSFGEGK